MDLHSKNYEVEFIEAEYSEDMKYLYIFIGENRHLVINVISMEFIK